MHKWESRAASHLDQVVQVCDLGEALKQLLQVVPGRHEPLHCRVRVRQHQQQRHNPLL